MDDLDREIEEAQRAARARVRRGMFATIASTGTFFVVGIVGLVVMFQLFPEPDESELDAQREARKGQTEEHLGEEIASDVSAMARDRSRMRWKVLPVFGLALASAIFVAKRLKPSEPRIG